MNPHSSARIAWGERASICAYSVGAELDYLDWIDSALKPREKQCCSTKHACETHPSVAGKVVGFFNALLAKAGKMARGFSDLLGRKEFQNERGRQRNATRRKIARREREAHKAFCACKLHQVSTNTAISSRQLKWKANIDEECIHKFTHALLSVTEPRLQYQ